MEKTKILKNWELHPDDYIEQISCESCGLILDKHFAMCPRCGSTAYHLIKHVKIEDE